MLTKSSRIFIAGHQGMVGSAIQRALNSRGYERLIVAGRDEVDLTSQSATAEFFAASQPEVVIIAAAKVGGIHANDTYPAEFIYENLMIECNCIHQAHLSDVEQLVFLGSSCIYPRLADQPMTENALLAGPLEPTNEPYAIAKIAGIKLCESYNRQHGRDYRSLMPTNLYGPGDNFHPSNSHVIPGLMRRIHEANEAHAEQVPVWGTGRARREFLHVDDLAAATAFVLELPRGDYLAHTSAQQSHINVGCGEDVSIGELAQAICDVVGFQGELQYDHSKPDGTPRKLLDTSLINALGWRPEIGLAEGLAGTYEWFLHNRELARG